MMPADKVLGVLFSFKQRLDRGLVSFFYDWQSLTIFGLVAKARTACQTSL